MPASVVRTLVSLPPQVETLSGGVRQGRAELVGGYTLDWRLGAVGLLRGRIEADLVLQGSDTLIEARLAATPVSITARDISGRAGAGLLALFPRVAIDGCTPRVAVAIDSLSARRGAYAAQGGIDIPEGACVLRDGREVPVPAMAMDLTTQGDDAVAVLAEREGAVLARAEVAGTRRLRLRIEPEGARLVPGMPSSAASEIELPF